MLGFSMKCSHTKHKVNSLNSKANHENKFQSHKKIPSWKKTEMHREDLQKLRDEE